MNDRFKFDRRDALLVIDVINDFEHDDGEDLLQSFKERLRDMVEVLGAARDLEIPVVYVNDDQDRWDSNAPALIERALESESAAEVASSLAPQSGEYFLLKHRYSAFDHTALDLLLEEEDVERIVLIGAATEGCIVQTAIDAREHGLKTTIIRDACATTDSELEEIALRYAEEVVGARIS
jgi:nicotinamidase-related amidase